MRKHDPLKRKKKKTTIYGNWPQEDSGVEFNRQGQKKILIVNKKKGNLAEERKL